jgi:hypothetical protein
MATKKTTAKKAAAPKAPIIVAAAMTADAGIGIGSALSGKMIEDAMSQAVLDAHAKGIVDDAKILKLKLAARDRVVAEHKAAEAKAAKAAAKG